MLLQLLVLFSSLQVFAVLPACPAATEYVSATQQLMSTLPQGQCTTYNAALPDGSLSFCNGIVNYPYFNPGYPQTALDLMAQDKLLKGNPRNGLLLSLLPGECTTQLKRAVCLAVFQACEYVDLYFLDKTCDTGTEICMACGEYTGNTTTVLLSPSELTPSYGSMCSGPGDKASACIVGPGKVPGAGNMLWKDYSSNLDQLCLSLNLVRVGDACLAAIPRTPCKSECNELWKMDVGFNPATMELNAKCPMISKDFSMELQFLLMTVTDPYALTQLGNMHTVQTNMGQSSLPLLTAFGLNPNCNDNTSSVFNFANDFIFEFLPDRTVALGQLISGRAQVAMALGMDCRCQTNYLVNNVETEVSTCLDRPTCAELHTRTSRCHSGGGRAVANSLVHFVKPNSNESVIHPLCESVVANPRLNQPSNDTLDIFQHVYRLASRQEAQGAFFVPPMPGSPALPSGKQSVPLCRFPSVNGNGQVFEGFDALSCINAQVSASIGLVPPFVQGTCRARFLDLLCMQAHMKLEFKSLCLLPGGCAENAFAGAQDHSIPFSFALPRFPAQSICTLMRQDCGLLFSSLSVQQQGLVNAAFNCTGKVEQTCEKNGAVSSQVWPCTSSLNGLSSYPVSGQLLADLSAYGLPAILNSLVGTSTASAENTVDTDPSFQAQSTCDCPYPLVVPDDPLAPTIQAGVCCAERCEGSLFSVEELDVFISMIRIIPIFSVFGSAFIFITWAMFKVKHSQPLTFFLSICSCNAALSFVIPNWYYPDVRTVWCKDNTQANKQSDGGMCLFQSIWLCYWVLATCCFWLVQGFDLYLRIVRNKRNLQRYTKYYHLFSWGYPALITSILLGTQSAGYESRNTWCFVRAVEPEREYVKTIVEMVLFYGSVVAIWLAGLIFVALVVKEIFIITGKASAHKGAGSGGGRGMFDIKRLSMFRTPMFFMFFFIFVWLSIFSWKFDSMANTESIRNGATNWVRCLLSNFALGIANPSNDPSAQNQMMWQYGLLNNSGCGNSYPVGPTVASYGYLMVIIGLQGMFIFVIFGARLENINLWREKLRLTSRKFDTTGKEDAESSTKNDRNPKPSILSGALSFVSSPKMNGTGKVESGEVEGTKGGGSAVMFNSIQSGKFFAVTSAAPVGPSSPPKSGSDRLSAANPVFEKESDPSLAKEVKF